MIRKMRFNAGVNAVLMILFGLICIFCPYGAGTTLAVIVGVMVIFSGIIDLARYLTAGPYASYLRGSLFIGILKVILGIIVVVRTDMFLAMFTAIFSIIIILGGAASLERALQLRRGNVPGWLVNAVLSGLVIAAGIGMLVHPVGAVSTAAVVIGIVLLVDGVTELLNLYQMKKLRDDFFQMFDDFGKGKRNW